MSSIYHDAKLQVARQIDTIIFSVTITIFSDFVMNRKFL